MTTPPKETTPPVEDSGSKLSAGTLRGWIKEEIANLLPGKSTQDSAPSGHGQQGQPPNDIRSEVATALEQLQAKEARKARDARVDKMLEEYEKPKEETVPVERRKVEKFMKWGD